MTSSPTPDPSPSKDGEGNEGGEEEDAASAEADDYEDWMLEFEHNVVKRWGWSLREIDETDMESLIPFVFYQQKAGKARLPVKRMFCDQVGWL
jgi:hypothetical protein